MFTGIVRELGRLASAVDTGGGRRLELRAPQTATGAAIGDSVAVNGVCLTVTGIDGETLAFDAVPETLARTTLGALAVGDEVNVEPALRAGEPFGGHIVQGHVDAVGRVLALVPEGDGKRLTVEAPPEILRYCVEKGSIAIEGVSLTVAALGEASLEIALVPHTLAATTLGSLRPDTPVNLEADVVAKYVERLLAAR